MIPASISEVTTAWLSDALKGDVREMEIQQIGQGVGLMGDIFRVTLEGEGVPDSVVVKLPSSFEENRTQGVALGMFDAEIRFYAELAPAATVGLPEIYYTDIECGTANFVIVMQDLSGLTMVDQTAGMSVEQAMAAVRVLGQIHAVWWDTVKGDDMAWIPDMISERIAFVDDLLTQILPVFSEAFADYLPEDGLEVYQRFSGNYLNVNKKLAARSPWTLVHQDFRVENMLFGPEGSGEVVVIDWQGIGRGPGSYDLAYILGGSLETDLRRDHEQALVRAYHESLTSAGVNGYSLEQLWQDYALSHLQGGLATAMVTGGSMDLSNERGVQLIATMACRHVQAALDHGGLAQLKEF
ncbi:MAG: phosphotransferase [Pseudomonadales bacterium]|nr:phosphotransferase [Pseudomonadales bacterium]